jgi:hypothetical protein
VSDSSHDGQDDPKGNDDGGPGAPPSELTAPSSIGSSTAAQGRPSAADQLTYAAPVGSGPSKKKRLVLASKHKQLVPSDPVTTVLFPHHAPHSYSSLVEVKLFLGAYLKFCNTLLRLPRWILLLWLTLSQQKGIGRC